MDENLILFQHFMSADMRIKNEILRMAPPTDYYDQDSLVKYLDRLYDSLDFVFSELKCVALDIFGKDSYELLKIKTFEKETKKAAFACGTDYDRLNEFYSNYISKMDQNFLDEVKENCIGYAFGWRNPMKSASTVNEMLHYMHASLVNNDHFLQSIPLLDEKINVNKEPISLRGVESDYFRDVFNHIPKVLDIGITDMVCLSDRKMIMMVRDRGHALTIEVTLENDLAVIEYFVPKLCNIDMVNSLPGVTKVNENSVGARGVFGVRVDELATRLPTFIAGVPTDMDMIDMEPDIDKYTYA